jgi:hypothetical protein
VMGRGDEGAERPFHRGDTLNFALGIPLK